MLANWTQPFSAANTIKSFPFLLSQGTTVHVPMMHQTELFAFGVDRELDCSVLQMDYRGDAVAFFVLPGKGKMWQLEKSLSARRLRKWNRSLQKRCALRSVCVPPRMGGCRMGSVVAAFRNESCVPSLRCLLDGESDAVSTRHHMNSTATWYTASSSSASLPLPPFPEGNRFLESE